MSTRCVMTARVDRHFARELDVAGERAMREHLPTCASCRARYDKHLLLEQLDPEAPGAEARIASGLGLGTRPPRLRSVAPFVAALAAAAAVAFLVTRPAGAPDDATTTGFTARGSDGGSAAAESSYVTVYRGGVDAGASRAGDSIRSGDELTFSYGNGAGKRYLMVFGVDEHRHVFWYYPAWTDSKEDPSSIAITPGAHPLPDAIRHEIDGAQLTMHAVFTDTPLTVRTVEHLVSAAPLGQAPSFGPTSIDRTIRFEVKP